jgi:hypothetical protein
MIALVLAASFLLSAGVAMLGCTAKKTETKKEAASATAASLTADQAASSTRQVQLKEMIGKEVTLTGSFAGPGKPGDYIRLSQSRQAGAEEEEIVYFHGRLTGQKPAYGQEITVVGILRYQPPVASPKPATPFGAVPQTPVPGYFLESAQVSAIRN